MHYDEYNNHKWARNLAHARHLLERGQAETFYRGEDLADGDVYPGMRLMAAYWVSVEHAARTKGSKGARLEKRGENALGRFRMSGTPGGFRAEGRRSRPVACLRSSLPSVKTVSHLRSLSGGCQCEG